MRNTEVRYTGTAIDGPFEQHDLSGFCSSENHAVKVGAYILSKRNHVTHRLQLGVRPDAFNPTLAAGDLVRVRLERVASTGAASLHDFLYEVDRIGKSLAGDVQLDLTHFPVDASYASVVAQEVNAATGSGLIVGTGLSGITCDINSFSDTSVPAETFTSGTFPNYGFSFSGLNESDLDDSPINNPGSGLGVPTPSLTSSGDIDDPKEGDTLTAPSICEGGQVIFYRVDPSAAGGRVIAAQATSTYTMIINDVDLSVYAEIRCPDPTSPDGYGEPIRTAITPTISPGCIDIPGITYNGTVPPPGNTVGAQIILENGPISVSSFANSPNDCTAAVLPPTTSASSSVTLQDVKGIELLSVSGTCGIKQLLWQVTYANGSVQDRNIVAIGDNRGFAALSAGVTTTWSGPGAIPYCP
jgi:hypothetical protein